MPIFARGFATLCGSQSEPPGVSLHDFDDLLEMIPFGLAEHFEESHLEAGDFGPGRRHRF